MEKGINWMDIRNGALAIGHKPSKRMFNALKRDGCSCVVTLLSEKEGARSTETMTKNRGMSWLGLPMVSAVSPGEAKLPAIMELFKHIEERLDSGEKVFIHCSAGIHRTGMVVHGLLRYLGYNADDAIGILKQLREITAAEAGAARIKWGDQFQR